jgi:hypothetical protein
MPRISLRQLLLLVAAIALALVSLKYASPLWQAIVGLVVLLAFFTAGIRAIVDRGPRQAFGMAMAIVMLSYGLLFVEWLGVAQQLPTNLLLIYAHNLVNKDHWVKPHSGEIVPQGDVGSITWNTSTQAYNLNGVTVELQYYPPVDEFVRIGHYWWALLLGYLGGCFAQFVYLRQTKELAAQAKE